MIQVKNLSKFYGKVAVFENLSIDLPDKGLFLLCGPNGCGKSTLIYILSGLDNDYIGQAIINGKDIKALNDKENMKLRRKTIGLIFSHGNLFSSMSVKDNLLYDGNIDSSTVKDNLLEKRPFVLSGGEEAMVSLTNEFGKKKPIYLIDELTSPLNEENVIKVMDVIKKQSEESLILMATHDKRIMDRGEKVYIRNGGQK